MEEKFFQAAPSSATRSRPVRLLILRLERRSKLSCFYGARRRATMTTFCLLLRLPPSVLFSNFLVFFGLRSVFVSLTPRLRFSHRSSDYARNQDSWNSVTRLQHFYMVSDEPPVRFPRSRPLRVVRHRRLRLLPRHCQRPGFVFL